METDMEIDPSSSELLDLDTIRSRARERESMLTNWNEDVPESKKMLKDCVLNFNIRIDGMVLEWSDMDFLEDNDFEECLECLSEELKSVSTQSTKMCQDIEALSRTRMEEYGRLEVELETLKCSMDFPVAQDPEKVKVGVDDDYTGHSNDQSNSMNVSDGDKLQLLDFENQIAKKNAILKSLEDLDCILKWFEVTEQIEDSFSSVKVNSLDENCIRISLQTYIPISESLLSQQKLEAANFPFEAIHELQIEILEGTINQKNVQIFPNDVHINGVLSAEKDFGESSLRSIVTKVQARIFMCKMRQLVVKSASKSGWSLEYLDKDEIVLAHLATGIDAFIKVNQGWPISSSPLKLASIMSSDHNNTKESFPSKVKEEANSLAAHIRLNLLSFVDNINKILVEQKQLEI